MQWSRARLNLALRGSDPVFGRALALALHAVIVASALIITLESLPDLEDWMHRALRTAEYAVLLIFTIEYALRLWSAPDRLRYATSFWGIIDLLSVLPALLLVVPEAQSIRLLRLMRAMRLLKLLRLSRAMARIQRAFVQSREELMLFTFAGAILLFLAAVGIYHFEHEAQPEKFGSIPASLWWALATLSTVGYGDVYPITTGGRVFTGLILLIGLGIVAIPAGVITSALLTGRSGDEDRRQR